LPAGHARAVSLGCESAVVTILDSEFAPVVEFYGVSGIGDMEFCEESGFGAEFLTNPGADFGASR